MNYEQEKINKAQTKENDKQTNKISDLKSDTKFPLPDKDKKTEKIKKKPILSESELNKRKAKKKRFAFAAFVLLLGIGVMGNWYYENSDLSQTIEPLINSSDTKTLGEAEFVGGTTQATTESEYFSSARVNRQSSRDSALDELQKIVDSSDNDDELKKQAQTDIAKLSSIITIENKIETLVLAKGVNNCIAIVNDDATRVDVVVDVDELDDKTIMQIKEIAMQQLDCDFESVSIIQSN